MKKYPPLCFGGVFSCSNPEISIKYGVKSVKTMKNEEFLREISNDGLTPSRKSLKETELFESDEDLPSVDDFTENKKGAQPLFEF